MNIVGIVTFYSLEVKLPTGKDQRFPATKPGFQLAKNIVHLHGLTYADMDIPGAKTEMYTSPCLHVWEREGLVVV